MFGSVMLDVAIGLIFLYLVLSLISSAVAELLEVFLRNRARDLERGIRLLLGEPHADDLTQRLFAHPLINALSPGKYDPARIRNSRYGSGADLPSYIPSRSFALALLDIVAPEDRGAAPGAPDQPRGSLQGLRGAVARVQNDYVRQALGTLLDAAGDDIDRARENVEQWFDSAMDRVSGWYKRRTQLIIFLIGVGVAVAVNADTVSLANSLAREKPLRDSLVALAQGYAEVAPALPAEDPRKTIGEAIKQIQSSEALGLPLGWDGAASWPKNGLLGWLLKAVGWLITAMAISLGAPFWFDLLKRFVSIRSSGKAESVDPRKGAGAGSVPANA
jgi:hypothetical protein